MRSTTLSQGFRDALHVKDYAFGTSIDIEKAFDSISFETIETFLLYRSILPMISRWIGNMITSRIGFPQGGMVTTFSCLFLVVELQKNGLIELMGQNSLDRSVVNLWR